MSHAIRRVVAQGNRLRCAMDRAGLIAPQLARLVKLDHRRLHGYLHYDFDFEEDGNAGTLAAALGVSVRWLLTGEPSEAAQAAIAEFERLDSFERLSRHDRMAIREMFETLPGADELQQRD